MIDRSESIITISIYWNDNYYEEESDVNDKYKRNAKNATVDRGRKSF